MIHNHWLSITHHDSQPLVQHNSEWLTTTGSALRTMTHNYWFSITHHDSQPLAQHYTPCFTITGPPYHVIIHNHWLISFITNGSARHTITKTQSAQYNTTYFTPVRFSIAHMNSKPLAQHNTPWFTTTGSAYHTIIHNHWFSITHHDYQPLVQHDTP